MESNADMMLKKRHIEALKRLKEGNEYARDLLAEQPDANDAYVALGTDNYVIGSLSGGARFFLKFGGIHGDKKLEKESRTTRKASNDVIVGAQRDIRIVGVRLLRKQVSRVFVSFLQPLQGLDMALLEHHVGVRFHSRRQRQGK